MGMGIGLGLGRVGAKEELIKCRKKKKETHNTIIRRTD